MAVATAELLSEFPLFKRISFVISDAISMSVGGKRAGTVQLVRVRKRLTKDKLQSVLSDALPVLLNGYNAAAVGVDIDFSGGGYSELVTNFSKWSSGDPQAAQKILNGVGYYDEGAALDVADVKEQLRAFKARDLVKGDADPNSLIDTRFMPTR